jgi:hypothetical protein
MKPRESKKNARSVAPSGPRNAKEVKINRKISKRAGRKEIKEYRRKKASGLGGSVTPAKGGDGGGQNANGSKPPTLRGTR